MKSTPTEPTPQGDDAARLRFIERLHVSERDAIDRLLAIEQPEELLELKRVAMDEQWFEVAAAIAKFIKKRTPKEFTVGVSTCSTCGTQWPTGTDGSHSCTAALSAALARSEEDRERLNWLEELIRNCPHAEFYFNDDTCDEKPDGFSIEVRGCDPLSVSGKSLRETIDAAKENFITHE